MTPACDEAISKDQIPAGTTATLSQGVTFSRARGWVYDGPPFPDSQSVKLFDDGHTRDVATMGAAICFDTGAAQP